MTMKVVVLYFIADKAVLARAIEEVGEIAASCNLTVETVRPDCQSINVADDAAADELLVKLRVVADIKTSVELDSPKTIPVVPVAKNKLT